MKKLIFGTPEPITPARFCRGLLETESESSYPTDEISFETTSRGCLLKLPLDPNEHIYGLGLQLKSFDLTGRKFTLRPNADPVAPTGDSHAPVPFFVSTKGYGVFVDTARYAEFYFGSSEPLRMREDSSHTSNAATNTDDLYRKQSAASQICIHIPACRGVTLYLFEGETITDIVSQYNRLSGGGCAVPTWGLAPIYRCYSNYTQEQVLSLARSFREDGFDIGTIGLEPGWQSHVYSCSYVWNEEKYPAPAKLTEDLRDLGYHISLWEHAFVHPSSPIYRDLLPYSGDYEVWQGAVPDFALPEARKIFSDHHKTLTALGIDAFKLDECDSSDITGSWSFPNHAKFPSGMDGEQYHSLFGTLYMQAVLEALGDTPTLSQVRNAGALCASYPFVLYSDLYDLEDFIRGCAVSGFSGLLWSPEVRDAQSKEEFLKRLQANVFSAQCLINAWYCERAPWEDLDCADEVKYWLEVRRGLIPRLEHAFALYHEQGVPPIRALVSDYSHDPETYAIDDEYLFGEDLLVAPLRVGEASRTVYLPEGNWQDYFTGAPVPSGRFEAASEQILVYKKARG